MPGLLLGALLLCVGCAGTPAPRLRVRLDAGPVAAPFVAPVHILVSGLPPGGLVSLSARARDAQGRPWESAARFRASASGTLNLESAVPVSGSYHVADAGGLLWSLHPAYPVNSPTQFYMPDSGFSVTVQVHADGKVQATTVLHRLAPVRTSAQTVASDGFASTMFFPARLRPGAPVVVVIGGSAGGEPGFIAGALAASGYPAMALGYFAEPGLPSCLCDVPLEYFARAVGWLRAQPATRGRRLVLYGTSRGGEGALLIASYEPGLFSAVIASSPSSQVNDEFGGPLADAAWTWQGRPLAAGMNIPVNRIRVPLLIGDGGQDATWDSAASAAVVVQELNAAHDPAPYTNLYYPRAGHGFLGAPPYFPYDGLGANGNDLGGSQQANAIAEEQSWATMLKFLNDPWHRSTPAA